MGGKERERERERINSRSSDYRFRDLVRDFIEVFEVMISTAARSAGGISSDGRATREMTAFIHYSHLSLSSGRGLSFFLSAQLCTVHRCT